MLETVRENVLLFSMRVFSCFLETLRNFVWFRFASLSNHFMTELGGKTDKMNLKSNMALNLDLNDVIHLCIITHRINYILLQCFCMIRFTMEVVKLYIQGSGQSSDVHPGLQFFSLSGNKRNKREEMTNIRIG